ncbi:MAG: SMR family transporter [Rhodospirillales bacterium]
MSGNTATPASASSPAASGRTQAWVLMAIAIVLLNAGNLLLESTFKHRQVSLLMFFDVGFVAAIVCLGASFFVYVKALATLPLAVAYPVMVGISLIIVAVVGWLWLDVPLDARQMAGIGTVFAGVTLISRSAGTSAERFPE